MEIEEAAATNSSTDLEKGVALSTTCDDDQGPGMYLVWEDLTVVIPSFGKRPTRRLINGVRGVAEPCRIMAIMGRVSGNAIMTGNVLLNGSKRRLPYGVAAYVTQEDALMGTLTVKETITYSAHLRLPTTLTKDDLNGIIEGTIMEMGLQGCSDHVIGNWHLRGISGGEKKRLSIALELLTRPRLIFLDEPTTGLDSASAFFVTQVLRNVSRDGRTVVCSIHQPNSEVFALFDDLFLISGGETVYFGEAKMAVEDTQKSSTLMNMTTAEIKNELVEKYKYSKYAKRAKARIHEISIMKGLAVETKTGSQATWCKQLSTLTRRSFLNMSRDIGYYWLRLITYTAVSICVGTIFFDVGTSYSSILARGACSGFISGYMIIMSIGGFPSFIEEMKIFYKERLNGHYGVGVFILSNFLSSFPFLAMMSLSTVTITYYMVKLHPGFSHYIYTYLDLLSSIAVIESCMMVVASLVPNFLMGLITGAGIIGEYKNDMIGLEFDPLQPGDPKLKGKVIINTVLGVSLDHSKWWDLAVVVIILIVYRLLFFIILKFKERASPLFRKLYIKRTVHYLSKRPSFRKTPPFPSQRHQVIHSLSSQEGLNSPIH
ncbi:hypothetical protein RHSIM_Rhsim13G0217900 [Rhododendron simsii]|uniref:ABC transporter domain-containing protein n=1 Tax=Rhododendron simsii TaxID=118357 RepID=A0A834G111_RHOSS|nr:hypothetical protein RHSIM_Rhsim13G0217900 [Rhododendron simsii]